MARGAELARIWMHNGMLQMGGEKMAKSVGNITSLADALPSTGPRRADHVLRLRATTASRSVRRRRRWRRRAAGVRRVREAGAAARRRAPRRRTSRRTRSASSPRWPTTSTRRPRSPRSGTGSARPTAARPAPATPTCARCSQCFGLEDLLDAAGGTAARRGGPRPARAARGRPRRARLRPRPTACATSSPPRAGRCATRPTARSSCARSVSAATRPLRRATPSARRLRAGPAARVHRVWATRGAAAEPWLRDVDVIEARASRTSPRGARERGPPGPVRRGRARTPTSTRRSCWSAPDPFVVVLDEVQDPQNLGRDLPHGRVRRAPTACVIPERRSAEVTPAVCKASAGAVEHLAVARVRNVADFLAAAKDAGCWCYGAAAEGAEHYLQPDYSGGCVLVIGAEGGACDRASPRPATSWWRCRCAGTSSRSTPAPPRPRCCTGSCRSAMALDSAP